MSHIANFNWEFDSSTVKWLCNGVQIAKAYNHPIRSAIPLADRTGVAVVEPFEAAGRDNAVVFDCNGSERFRLKFPLPEPHGNCFDQMYYIKDRLNAFANLGGTDFRYEIDEKRGEVLASFESR